MGRGESISILTESFICMYLHFHYCYFLVRNSLHTHVHMLLVKWLEQVILYA